MSSIEPTDPTRTETYAIRITGELGEHWQAWFEGMTVEQPGDGTTVITKHPGTGGAVTVGTVTAQLLYEIQGLITFYPHFRTAPPPTTSPVRSRGDSCRRV